MSITDVTLRNKVIEKGDEVSFYEFNGLEYWFRYLRE